MSFEINANLVRINEFPKSGIYNCYEIKFDKA